MSHEIESTDNMVSAKGILPWHGLGVVRPEPFLTAAEALQYSGMAAINMVKAPILHNGIELPASIGQFIVREDTGRVMGIVKGRYTICQYSEAFGLVDCLMEGGAAQIETAGTLRHGARGFIVAQNGESYNIGGDDHKQYLVFLTSHDGSGAIQVMLSDVRVVCANTRAAAIGSADYIHKAKHTANYEAKVMEAKKLLQSAESYKQATIQMGEKLLAVPFSKTEWDALLCNLCPVTDDMAKAGITRSLNTRDALKEAYSADDLDNVRGTAWGALQAILDYSDHGRTLKDMPDTNKAERAFMRAFEDNDLKQAALRFIAESSNLPELIPASK